jgi:hypothetical protein
MHAPEWIALFGPLITVATIGIGAIIKLTRLVDAVKELGESMRELARTDRQHERRLRRLERDREDRVRARDRDRG